MANDERFTAPTTVGVVGLGLIGGSFAKAYADSDIQVYGLDIDEHAINAAIAEGTVVGVLDAESLPKCQLVLLALYPESTVEWLRNNAQFITEDSLVIDCGGVKRIICEPCFQLAEEYGFSFVGGHPMAGTQFSGFRHARGDMFLGQPMVLVPPEIYNPSLIARVEAYLAPAGFKTYSVTTAAKHDQIIAYTSQLAHVVSSAYAKSPTAQRHLGFSAGSYRDLTRVAELNPDMWDELFLENADFLESEVQNVIDELVKYRDAIHDKDQELLHRLLEEGTIAKLKADGRYRKPRQ